MNSLKRFFEQEHGVTAIEYSLVALLVALVIIVGATALGLNLGSWYGYIASKFPPTPAS
jgi:pilus assembly protein Flp/PilA